MERTSNDGGGGRHGRNVKHGNDGNDGERRSDEPGRPYAAPHGAHGAHSRPLRGHNASPERLLPPRGDYRTLFSFQKAQVVYDITFRFAHKFLAKGDRTIDQMIQSARSGKTNILEGSKAAVASKETEIKLTNVARASLEELLADYLDFLRVRDLPLWDKDGREARYVRDLGRGVPQTFEIYREIVETRPAAVVANIAICLIHQTNYLIDRQLRRLERDFLEHGGLRERMTRARLQARAGRGLGGDGNDDRGGESGESGSYGKYGKYGNDGRQGQNNSPEAGDNRAGGCS